VVPIVIASGLGALLFAVLFGLINIGPSDDWLVGGVAKFILSVMAAGLAVRILLVFLQRLFTRHTLTEDCLMVERGILSRSTNDIYSVTARSVSDEAVSTAQLGIASSACGLLAMTRPGVIPR
jgi:uncharacterized membrane protein YdbT with pleckstrin-like domain